MWWFLVLRWNRTDSLAVISLGSSTTSVPFAAQRAGELELEAVVIIAVYEENICYQRFQSTGILPHNWIQHRNLNKLIHQPLLSVVLDTSCLLMSAERKLASVRAVRCRCQSPPRSQVTVQYCSCSRKDLVQDLKQISSWLQHPQVTNLKLLNVHL